MTKITQLITSNVKRLSAVQIKPDGSLVIIGGDNGAGKTSVLDSIMYALAGKSAIPAQPVKRGAKKGKVVVDLDNGLRITRTMSANGGGTLTVTDENEAKQTSPQAILNKLVGQLTFDPLEYQHMKPPDQAKTLRDLGGVSTAKLDHERQKLYDERTVDNREVAKLKARLDDTPKREGVPAQEVSVVKLTEQLVILQQQTNNNEADRGKATRLERVVDEVAASLDEADKSVARLTKELEQAKGERDETQNHWKKCEEMAEMARAFADKLTDPDLDEVRNQIATAEETNKLVRDNAARAELVDELRVAQDDTVYLTEKIETIDAEKAAMLETAELPVAGLGFDENGVTLNGVPLEQASGAEVLRVSVAMGLAMNPELRVLLIRDGSLLDQKSLAMVADMAEKADAQVWLERVGDGDEGAIIIEDGAVRAADAAE